MTRLLDASSGAIFTMVRSVPMLRWQWRSVPAAALTKRCLSQAPAAASALKTMPLSPTTRPQESNYGLGDMMVPLTIRMKRFALAVSPDGKKIFVTGRSFGQIGEGRDFATVAYSAINGQALWVSRYDGLAHGEDESNDEAYSIAVSTEGERVFVTGSSGGMSARVSMQV